MSQLNRFLEAQEEGYELALEEIRKGKKKSPWMEYIFPIIVDLKKNELPNKYGIKNIEEAIEYLNNNILKNRLIESCRELLNLGVSDIKKVLGKQDALNLKSSMTLFKKAEEISDISCNHIFQNVLKQYYNGKEDIKTICILNNQKDEKLKDDNGTESKEKQNENDNPNLDLKEAKTFDLIPTSVTQEIDDLSESSKNDYKKKIDYAFDNDDIQNNNRNHFCPICCILI